MRTHRAFVCVPHTVHIARNRNSAYSRRIHAVVLVWVTRFLCHHHSQSAGFCALCANFVALLCMCMCAVCLFVKCVSLSLPLAWLVGRSVDHSFGSFAYLLTCSLVFFAWNSWPPLKTWYKVERPLLRTHCNNKQQQQQQQKQQYRHQTHIHF